jgi:hypothetical protein
VALAAPASGHYEYRGSMIVTAIDVVSGAPKTCAASGYSVGSEYDVRFTPPGSSLGKNGTQWRPSIF